MAKSVLARSSVDLEPIERLEEKVKLLVTMVTRLRAEHAKLLEEHERLTEEAEVLRAKAVDADELSGELHTLRDERKVIRDRVSEMLEQLEGL